MSRGLIISVEGIDGSGKSTQIKYIEKRLKEKYNKDVIITREPGGTPLAEKLRNLVLSTDEENLSADAEALMFSAARKIHLDNLIIPSLNEGKIVISDRFSDSMFAYQCAHGADYDRIKKINDWTLNGFKADYTFLFFVSPEVAKERLVKRKGNDKDRFDEEAKENNSFVEKTYSIFIRRLNEGDSKYIIIDSSKSVENTQSQIDLILDKIFEQYNTL